jgi:hypothetical protein
MAKRIQRGNSIRVLHHYLGKRICETHIQSPEESVQYLARIATDAHYRYRSSAKKRLQHLEVAAKTFTPAALTRYLGMFYLDKGMQSFIRHLEPKEEPVKRKPSQTSIRNSLEKMSERDKYRELRRLMIESTGELHEDV